MTSRRRNASGSPSEAIFGDAASESKPATAPAPPAWLKSRPRPAETSNVSAARHALPSVAVERSNEPSAVLPLLSVVIGLAAATTWFVALPILDKPQQVARTCEVFVLKSGKTKCVPDRLPRAKPSSEPKR